ncbi:hypothetical protein P2A10_13475 [Xanthomonas perforans]
MNIFFPKTHEVFASDEALLRKLRKVEDRIEQGYQVEQLKRSLIAIIDIVGEKREPARTLPSSKGAIEAMQKLLRDNAPPSELDLDREVIWRMQRKAGTEYVLAFLSPGLWGSLEELFAGIVVFYQQMFTSSSRAMLNEDRVFAGRNDLKVMHDEIKRVRNKQYAHKELEHDRHRISYFIDSQGGIKLDVDAAHSTTQYHATLYTTLFHCLCAVDSYLKKDIRSLADNIVSSLTEVQRDALKAQASSV